jgi:hypothetical protein
LDLVNRNSAFFRNFFVSIREGIAGNGYTFNIFRHPESYHFCKTTLCNPKGGSMRDTIKFTVVIEDADGDQFAADTHSIFYTHTNMFGLGLEDYANRTVTAGYNEETGQVVIIN